MPDMERRRWPHWVAWCIAAAGLVACLLWRVEPGLTYGQTLDFPAFSTTTEHFVRTLWAPAGLTYYLSAFLAQLFAWPWLAVLVVAALVALLGLLVSAVLRASGAPGSGWTPWLIAALAVASQARYVYSLHSLVGAAFALTGLLLYARLWSDVPGRRVANFLFLSALIWAVAGGLYVVFAAGVGFAEIRRGHRLAGLVALLVAEAAPYALGVVWLGYKPQDAFRPLLGSDTVVDVPLLLLLSALYLLCALSASPRVPEGQPTPRTAPPWRPLLAALFIALLAEVCTNHQERTYLRLAQPAAASDWDTVLARAARIPRGRFSLNVCSLTNRALIHRGRLLESMFSYPQVPEGLLLGMISGPGLSPGVVSALRQRGYAQVMDAYLELGLPNVVEHHAHEMLEQYGDHALTLRLLAMVNLVKDRPEAARVFLEALTHNLVRRQWALRKLAQMDRDPSMAGDPALFALRQAASCTDRPGRGDNLEEHCLDLLKDNPANRQALDYLIALYLLNRRLDDLAAALPRFAAAGYVTLPRHCQEALVFLRAQRGHPGDLHGYTIDLPVAQSFDRFSTVFNGPTASTDREGTRASLARSHGNTYFYYYCYGRSGEGELP